MIADAKPYFPPSIPGLPRPQVNAHGHLSKLEPSLLYPQRDCLKQSTNTLNQMGTRCISKHPHPEIVLWQRPSLCGKAGKRIKGIARAVIA